MCSLRSRFSVLAFAAIALAVGPTSPTAQDGRVERLKSSDIVFDGTVTAIGQTNVPTLPATNRTLLVRVEEIHEKPAAISLRVGDVLTVETKESGSLRAGDRATFYTTGWIFAKSIAVREVGHELHAGPRFTSKKEIAGMRRAADESLLAERLRAAEIVIVGQVRAVQPVARDPRAFESEHDPQWHEATVRVEEGLKGATAGEQLVVRFAASDDVRWFRAPKLKVGERAVFLLARDQVSKQLLAIDPGNVLSEREAANVRRLLQR